MKYLFNKMMPYFIGIVASVFVGGVFPLSAQTTEEAAIQQEEKTYPVGEFSALEISDDFEVSLSRGDCAVRVTVDKPLADYVQVFVRSKTLFVTYDEKAVPKEVKKLYKGGRKGPQPVFRVSVSMKQLTGISLSDRVILDCPDSFNGMEKLEVKLTDKAQLASLSAEASVIKVNLRKNAEASMNLRSLDNRGRIEVSTDDNTMLKLTANAYETTVASAGNSVFILNGESSLLTLNSLGKARVVATERTETATCMLSGSSDMAVTGSADDLTIKSEGRSSLDASSFPVQKVKATMNGGCKAGISVSDNLEVDLSGGCSLIFSGAPVVRILKVEKSTIAPKSANVK